MSGVIIVLAAHSANGFGLSLAGRYWSSSWETENLVLEIPEASFGGYVVPSYYDTVDSMDSSGVGMYGLGLTLHLTDAFSFNTTFMTGNYDVEIEYEQFIPAEEVGIDFETEFRMEQSVTRYDIDLAFQYRINRYLTAIVGYKSLTYSFENQVIEQKNIWGGRDEQYEEPEIGAFDISYTGPGAGLSGFWLFPNNFFYYGVISALPYLKASGDADERLEDTDGWAYVGEVGLGYAVTESFVPTLGWKYQQFSGFGELSEIFNGVTVGLSYRF